ncbi:MAG: cytochrome P450 [Pseudomonadota bacterium]
MAAALPDLTDPNSFAHGFPHAAFAELRQRAPPYWHEATPHTPDGEGFWVLSRHADCAAVLRNPARYSSQTGGHRTGGGTGLRDERTVGTLLNMTDDPAHRRLRSLISKGFTPKALAALVPRLETVINTALDGLPADQPFDAMTHIAGAVPLAAIAGLLGVDTRVARDLMEAIDKDLSDGSGRIIGRTGRQRVKAAAQSLITERRRHPGDDVFSAALQARFEDDGSSLRDDELIAFFALLFPAGAETTRSAIGQALFHFAQDPDCWNQLATDDASIRCAVEEIVRWATPSIYKRRTVTEDHEWYGETLRAGDKITIWEPSANRDGAVFDAPDRFDLERWPNHHLGFGAGVHFCLGASLARLEIGTLLRVLKDRNAHFELCGPPTYRPSTRLLGFSQLPLRMSPGLRPG